MNKVDILEKYNKRIKFNYILKRFSKNRIKSNIDLRNIIYFLPSSFEEYNINIIESRKNIVKRRKSNEYDIYVDVEKYKVKAERGYIFFKRKNKKIPYFLYYFMCDGSIGVRVSNNEYVIADNLICFYIEKRRFWCYDVYILEDYDYVLYDRRIDFGIRGKDIGLIKDILNFRRKNDLIINKLSDNTEIDKKIQNWLINFGGENILNDCKCIGDLIFYFNTNCCVRSLLKEKIIGLLV